MKRIAELQAFVASNAPGDDTATLELSRDAAAELLEEVENSMDVAASNAMSTAIRNYAKAAEYERSRQREKIQDVRLTGL